MSEVNHKIIFRDALRSVFFSLKSIGIWISILCVLFLYTYVQDKAMHVSSEIYSFITQPFTLWELFVLAYRVMLVSSIATGVYYFSLFLKKYIGLYWRKTFTLLLLDKWIFSRQFTHVDIENIDKRLTDDIENISVELALLLHNGTNSIIQLCIFVPKFIYEIQKGGIIIVKIAMISMLCALCLSMLNLCFNKYISYYHKQQLETSGALRQAIKGTDQMSSSIAMLNGKEATMKYLQQQLENDTNAQQKNAYLYSIQQFMQSIINKVNASLGNFLFLPLAGMGLVTTIKSRYAASLVWPILYAAVFLPQNLGKISTIRVSLKRLAEIYAACSDDKYTGLVVNENNRSDVITDMNHEPAFAHNMHKDTIDTDVRIHDKDAEKAGQSMRGSDMYIADARMNDMHQSEPINIHANIFIQKKHALQLLLQNINITLSARERILLYGKSGTGKTTLLHALHGHYTHASGTISMPNDAKLFFLPHKTLIIHGDIYQNIAYPSETYDQQKIEHILHKILPLYKTLDMRNLSAGERQKIQIARLLYLSDQNYHAIFLDEPLSNIDKHESKFIMQLLYDTFPNSAIVISMHDGIEILGNIFDRLINLEQYILRE